MALVVARLGVARLGATRLGLMVTQQSLVEESFEVAVLSAAVTSLSRVERNTKAVLVTVEEGDIRYRTDGGDPTASIGHRVKADDAFRLTRSETLSKARFIAASGSPILTVTYFDPYNNPFGDLN